MARVGKGSGRALQRCHQETLRAARCAEKYNLWDESILRRESEARA